jgi:hypothetical protein
MKIILVFASTDYLRGKSKCPLAPIQHNVSECLLGDSVSHCLIK